MADLYGMMMDGLQAGRDGYQRGQQTKLAGLVGQAYSAPAEQRQQLLNQVAQTSPQAAYDAEAHFKGMDDNARQRLGQYAAAFDALPDEQKPMAYPQLAQQAQQLGIPAPSEWRPEFAQNISKLAQTLGGGAANGVHVSSRYVTNDGDVIALMSDGSRVRTGDKANPNIQIMEQEGQLPYGVVTRGGVPGSVVPLGGQQPQGGIQYAISPDMAGQPQPVLAGIQNAEQAAGNRPWTQNTPDFVGGQAPIPPQAYNQRIPGASAGPVPVKTTGQKAAEAEAAKQGVELGNLPARGRLEAENERLKAVAKGSAEAEVAQTYGTDESRKNAAEARKKIPQLGAVRRGVDRIGQALRALNLPGVNTGPLDQFAVRMTPAGQELETAVGEIQNSMLALVRVPGVGSQSDLEARVAAMQYPALNRHPEVNARTMANLQALYQDLQAAYDNVINGAAPQSREPNPNAITSGGGGAVWTRDASGKLVRSGN